MDKTYTVEIPNIGKIAAEYETFNEMRHLLFLAEIEAYRKMEQTRAAAPFISAMYEKDYNNITEARRIILDEVIESEE